MGVTDSYTEGLRLAINKIAHYKSMTECSFSNISVFNGNLCWRESITQSLGLALLTLSWDKNWDSHSLLNGYPSFYPRIALVAPSPGESLPSYFCSMSIPQCLIDIRSRGKSHCICVCTLQNMKVVKTRLSGYKIPSWVNIALSAHKLGFSYMNCSLYFCIIYIKWCLYNRNGKCLTDTACSS